MTFEEWFKHTAYTDKDCAEDAYEAGIQEGIERMSRKYVLEGIYEICPECSLVEGKHKLDCSYGR
jgi:hypothetical protein